MSADDILEKANDRGFRLHQCYQRYPMGKKDKLTNWYFDVVLVHTTSVWDYFNGTGETLEDAIRDAYTKGKAKLKSIEGLTGKEKLKAMSPMAQLKDSLRHKESKPDRKRRVRL